MIALIARLIDAGMPTRPAATCTSTCAPPPGYGALSGQRLADMRPAEERRPGRDGDRGSNRRREGGPT